MLRDHHNFYFVKITYATWSLQLLRLQNCKSKSYDVKITYAMWSSQLLLC